MLIVDPKRVDHNTPLYIDLTDYVNANSWRWVLYAEQHAFVADHQVALDPTSTKANAFANLDAYLHDYQPIHSVPAPWRI